MYFLLTPTVPSALLRTFDQPTIPYIGSYSNIIHLYVFPRTRVSHKPLLADPNSINIGLLTQLHSYSLTAELVRQDIQAVNNNKKLCWLPR